MPDAPATVPLRVFTASNGAEVYLKADVDARDEKIGPWIVELRGAWFSCWNDVEATRKYYDEQD